MWEDQGRQFHQWFGHGTSGTEPSGDAPRAMTITDAAAAVAAKVEALLPETRRQAYGAYLASRGVGELKTAIPIWSAASHLDAATFRTAMVGAGFRPEGAAQVHALGQALAGPLTAEAVDAAAVHLAAAISGETASRWSYALNYARDKAVYSAVNERVALARRPPDPPEPSPPVPVAPLVAGTAAAAGAGAGLMPELSVPTWMTARAALGLLGGLGAVALGGLMVLLTPTTVADATIRGRRVPPVDPGQGPVGGTVVETYVQEPKGPLKGFPGSRETKRKTSKQGGGGLRKRWLLPNGKIAEWDYQHGDVEVYNKRGKHEGSYDPENGEQTKDSVPGREVEP